MSCFHLNCRSFASKLTSIQCLLNSIDAKFDIIAFSETWLNDMSANFYSNSFPGYTFYYSNHPDAQQGGGVAAFIKSSLEVHALRSFPVNSFEHLEFHITKPYDITHYYYQCHLSSS